MEEVLLTQLKINLLKHGAMRPQAWQTIVLFIKKARLKANESFIRSNGAIAYIAEGILKEYSTQNRKNPSIINFFWEGKSIITRSFNKSYYLKACVPSIVLYIEYKDIVALYKHYKELITIYNVLSADYDESSALRQLILEQTAINRILLFNQYYKKILSALKKKDIANYLSIDYFHFIKQNNKLL